MERMIEILWNAPATLRKWRGRILHDGSLLTALKAYKELGDGDKENCNIVTEQDAVPGKNGLLKNRKQIEELMQTVEYKKVAGVQS